MAKPRETPLVDSIIGAAKMLFGYLDSEDSDLESVESDEVDIDGEYIDVDGEGVE